MECIENDGGSNSRTFLTQLIVCIVEAKFANDDEPAAIILKKQLDEEENKLWKVTSGRCRTHPKVTHSKFDYHHAQTQKLVCNITLMFY